MLWRRSTIPLSLEASVADTAIRFEKHPGRDDAHFLWLAYPNGARERLHVDRAVYQRLVPGSLIRKDAWQGTLEVDGEDLGLAASPDTRGMLGVFAISLAVVLAALLLTSRAVSP